MILPLLSIGIIFKNEIRCLERCLKSLRPLRDAISCEVVMADTGATDGSRAVAERYADILFDFPWINDFAAARNAVMDRCTGKWFMFIDCDEWLGKDLSGLVRFVTQDECYTYGAVTIRNYHSTDLDKSDDYADFIGCRLLRMSSGLRFVGEIHEHWPTTNGQQHILQIQTALFHHDGYVYADPVLTKKKHDRNMALLRERLKRDPDNLVTLMQCIESGEEQPEYKDYIKHGIRGVEEHWDGWKMMGPPLLRYSVIAAFKSGQYETVEEDIARAERMFPHSMYTRLDVEFVAFGRSWAKNDYTDCIRRGERYLKAWEDYQTGNYNPTDILCSTLSTSSTSFKIQVMIFLGAALLYEKQPGKCLSIVSQLEGGHMTLKHVGDVIRTCTHLHSRSHEDTAPLIIKLWEEIGRPTPSEERAVQRRTEFIRMASEVFLPAYQEDELGREDFCRHAYTLFLPLEGKCVLGDAAAILAETDSSALTKKLSCVEDLERLPVHALYHALECGASFPSEVNPLELERMDMLAGRMAQDTARLFALSQKEAENLAGASAQRIAWVRGLALSAVHSFDWKAGTGGVDVARAYAKAERAFLSVCYAPGVLNEKSLNILPPLHRFGFYCAQAFDALDAGNAAGYVRLLGEGLAVCGGVKDMVEFLIDHTPQIQTQAPPAELQALADQVRTILAAYPPDDPAVAVLKQSEAYQKVAYLIEGMEPPVIGGQPQ